MKISNRFDKKPTDLAQKSKVRDPMNSWYETAWVRGSQIDYKAPETESTGVLFSPHLVPALTHPLVVERGHEFAKTLLAHRFYTYADFTAVLEREAVNVVTHQIARKVFWTELPGFMYRGAGRIYTDEAFHAQESDEILNALVQKTGVMPKHIQRPRFMANLDLLCSNLTSTDQRLALVGFSVVSETLISAILADIPTDPSVIKTVRDYVREHAHDEGRHHAYFSQLLTLGWPGLTISQQEFLGPLLPKFIRWFLEPDLAWLRAFLNDEGFQDKAIDRLIEETYSAASITENVRTAARHSIIRFSEAGVLASTRIADCFVAEGLL